MEDRQVKTGAYLTKRNSLHTYHSRFIPEGVAEASQASTFFQNYLAMSNTADITGGKPIAV
jgi:hypothetical protein